jgi:hypothetical protein
MEPWWSQCGGVISLQLFEDNTYILLLGIDVNYEMAKVVLLVAQWLGCEKEDEATYYYVLSVQLLVEVVRDV